MGLKRARRRPEQDRPRFRRTRVGLKSPPDCYRGDYERGFRRTCVGLKHVVVRRALDLRRSFRRTLVGVEAQSRR